MGLGKVLVVDDDPRVAASVSHVLEQHGYRVHTATNGSDALELAQSWAPDLVVLDLNLSGGARPGEADLDGMDVLRVLRKQSGVCVLMLTATGMSFVKVAALRVGADDYLTKPFDHQELLARAEAILRRARGNRGEETLLRFRGLAIDPGARRVWRDAAEVKLTRLEFDVLCALVRRRGQVLTRQQLFNQAWETPNGGDERLVDVHMGNLRRKIEADPGKPAYIVTVWGKGYRFEGEPA